MCQVGTNTYETASFSGPSAVEESASGYKKPLYETDQLYKTNPMANIQRKQHTSTIKTYKPPLR